MSTINITNPTVETKKYGKEGRDITLSVEATTQNQGINGVLSYQWEKRNTRTGLFVPIVGEIRSTLRIFSLTSEDENDYRCKITNTYTTAVSLAESLVKSSNSSASVLVDDEYDIGYRSFSLRTRPSTIYKTSIESEALDIDDINAGQIASIEINDFGTGYIADTYDNESLTGGSGTGALANIVVSQVDAQTSIVSQGSGYPNTYIRVVKNITKAASAVVTSPNHGFLVSEKVIFRNVAQMTQINGQIATILAVTNNTFTVNVNSTGFTAYGPSTAISGITKANPGVVTSTSHGLTSGDQVVLSNILGMTQLNNTIVTVTVLTANTFSIGVNTTDYTTYNSGGIVVNSKSTVEKVLFEQLTINNSYEENKFGVVKAKGTSNIPMMTNGSGRGLRANLIISSGKLKKISIINNGTTVTATYSSGGVSSTTLVVNSTTGIRVGDSISGTGFTSGQTVLAIVSATNIVISELANAAPSGILTFSKYLENDLLLLEKKIQNISRAAQAVVTCEKHGLSVGDEVYIYGVQHPFKKINSTERSAADIAAFYTIQTVPSSDTFSIDYDTSSNDADEFPLDYVSGGYVSVLGYSSTDMGINGVVEIKKTSYSGVTAIEIVNPGEGYSLNDELSATLAGGNGDFKLRVSSIKTKIVATDSIPASISEGDTVGIYEVSGMTEINELHGRILEKSGDSLTLNIDSSNFSPYSANGKIKHQVTKLVSPGTQNLIYLYTTVD